MIKETKNPKGYMDFLSDDKFIEWRLLKSENLGQYWREYIATHPERSEDLNMAICKFKALRINDAALPKEVKQSIYNNILQRAKRTRAIRRRIVSYGFVAACIVLLIGTAFFFYNQSVEIDKNLHSDVTAMITGETLPETDIQLVTADEVITLQQDVQLALTKGGKSLVIDNNDRILTKELKEDVKNKLIVPAGKRGTLILADGSKVWLNSGSELEFPHHFSGNTRNITMKGEIYIEVATMPDKPFIVHTAGFDVRVYGTKFNISAYDDNESQSVVLVEGKVEVTAENIPSTFLKPSEMLSVASGSIDKSVVNTEEYTSWKDGVLLFRKTAISEILKKIGRYYNVEFQYNEIPLLKKTCSGKLVLSENLDDVMASLAVLSSISYHRENEKIYINNKNR